MRYERSRGIRYSVIVLTLSFAAGYALTKSAAINRAGSSSAAASDKSVRDFSVNPPKVDSMSAMRLKEPQKDGNTLLKVRFAREEQVPRQLPINLAAGRVILRDDGLEGDQSANDGVHSAVIDFDFMELSANRRRLEALRVEKGGSLKQPEFDGRVQVRQTVRTEPIESPPAPGPGEEIPIEIQANPAAIDPERSLIVRHTSVVEDPTRTFNPCNNTGTPMGKWTFGYLMQQMANQAQTGINPSAFVRQWLSNWEAAQTVNGFNVPARLNIRNLIINPWETASGGRGRPLDLSKAPFKLLAIVNRVDLRNNTVYGGTNGGEGRFVFGLIAPGCNADQMTVIFEYGIERSGCGVRDWGREWANLSLLPLGSPQYNQALENITEQFARAGAAPRKVNGSALNQLRTNEIALASPWELREFRLTMGSEDPFPPTGQLIQTTVKRTPDNVFNHTQTLADFVNQNEAAILSETHIVPLLFNGNPFLGGDSLTTVPNFFWDHRCNTVPIDDPPYETSAIGVPLPPVPLPVPCGITNREARFKFSFNTCNGCHGGETNPFFTHVKPVNFGFIAPLSGFLTGITVADPADGTPVRTFNDLARRALDLDALVNSPCFIQIEVPVEISVH